MSPVDRDAILGRLIHLPFLPEHETRMLHGIKTMTLRRTRHGRPGDLFDVFGARFLLTHVFRTRLDFAFADCWRQEGFACQEDLMATYWRLHPRARRKPPAEQIVWAHCFRQIDWRGG